ncbi:MAG: PKD domain-containing protein [Thermoplasmatota archaeon]
MVLSSRDNVTLGFVQKSVGSIWSDSPDFKLPTNAIPRTAVIGELSGDILPDIAVASARSDWSGSSLAIYPNRYPGQPMFCNGNATAWTNVLASPSMIATGDVDGNDILDLVTLNVQNSTFDYILNFTDRIRTHALGYIPGEMVVYDFNGDSCSEVVTTKAGSPVMTVAYWQNHTTVNATKQLLAAGNITDIAVGDFNDDGLQDIVVATDDGRLDFFLNDESSQAFGAMYEYAPTLGAGIWSIAVGDLNSDGLDDIAYTKSIRKINILLQSPSVPFGPLSATRNLSYNQGSDFTTVWTGDVTGDHKTDIVAMRMSDPKLYLFNQNDFVVSPYPFGTLDLPEVPKFISVMDATDDGHADVVAIFSPMDLLFLYRQNGSTLPASPSMVFVTGAGSNFAIIGDGTGDHRGDLLTNDIGSHSVSIWEQINFPPVAHAGGPYVTRQGDVFQFNGSAETGTSEIPYTFYKWDFGDGNVTGWIKESRPKHVYTEVAEYNVSLQVMDPTGLLSNDAAHVQVLDSVPHVGFTWSPTKPNEGQTVTLIDTSRSFDPVISTLWLVDGVVEGNGSILALEFQNGTHNVKLELTDSDGTVGWLNRAIVVDSMLPELRIDAPSYANESEVVAFRVLVDQWHNGPIDPIVKYEWDFLYSPGFFMPDPNAPNGDTASFVYSTSIYPQIFTVAVRATDSDGEVNMTTWNLRIYDSGPVANFALSTLDPQEGQPLSFLSTSSSFDGIINWSWVLQYPDGHSELFNLDGNQMADWVFGDLADGDYTMTLTVLEDDGNVSVKSVQFHVQEISPFVQMGTVPAIWFSDHLEEFLPASFYADVTSFDPIVTYEWDFDSHGAEFIPDQTTLLNTTSYTYVEVGNYTAKVRVTDSNLSSTVSMIYVEVRNKPYGGGFFSGGINVLRSAPNSNIITFDPSEFVQGYPDLIYGLWDFGDGESERITGFPSASVTHTFAEGKDYLVSFAVEDDDNAAFVMQSIIYVTPPKISLVEPQVGSVVKPGTPILFMIEPGSSALLPVSYDVNGEGYKLFSSMYTLDTSTWPDGPYGISIAAWDVNGNVATKSNLTITIDSEMPLVFLSSKKTTAFGGDKVNITVRVVDRNVVANGIILYVKFQGENAYSTFTVSKAVTGDFYRLLDIPFREGTISLYANVSDMAGNSIVTSLYSLDVELNFIYRAWPYLLLASLLAAVSTMGYFMRESTIAVDETFVIYNDGRMIAHSTRRLKPGMDDEVMSGMLVAIQDFVKESFKDITSFTLRKLEFGEKSVVIEKGDHLFLAVILHGHASKKVAQKMQRAVAEIERKFGPHLKDWDGDLEKMRGISDIVKKIYSKAPMLPTLAKENT